LSSIQGLVNQQDFKGANEYLTDFAQLIRSLLINNAKAETPLQREIYTLETYLKLEKLRFGFSYSIEIDENIDLSAISIPSLLWQPLVENAVKHGVAMLEASGRINILFIKLMIH
jgi:LytS/YehU family sensor histidine kinase